MHSLKSIRPFSWLLFLTLALSSFQALASEGIAQVEPTSDELDSTESAPEVQTSTPEVSPTESPSTANNGTIPEKLSSEEEKILQEIRQGKTEVKKEDPKGVNRANKKSRMKREDSRIMIEHMSVGDVLELKTCFGSPFRISFGESITDRISEGKLGNTAKFSADIDNNTRRSIYVTQKENDIGSVHTTLWLERNSDKRAYVFNIIGEPCPKNGLLQYPVEIILEDKVAFDNPKERVLLPTDFITEVTKNFPRKNDTNFISVNGMVVSANSTWSAIGVSIVLKGVMPDQTKKLAPKFIVTDWAKTRVIKSVAEYLKYPSQAETDLNGVATLRFNLKVNIGKKQIIERKYIYLIIMYEDDQIYQIAKVPVYDMMMGLKDMGWEI